MCTLTRSYSFAVRAVLVLSLMATCGCNFMSGRMTNQRGTMLYRRGNYTAAADEFRRAAIDDPSNPDYAYNLATAKRKMGDATSAEQSYRTALLNDPSHQPSYHGLAMLLKDQGRTNDAVSLMQSWTATQPYDAKSHIEMAWLQREIGDFAGAEQSLQQALKIKPNNATALANLGQVYQDMGQTQLASAMYQRSLHNNWNQPQVHSRLAQLNRPQNGSTMMAGMGSMRFAQAMPMTTTVVQAPIVSGPVVATAPVETQTFAAPITADANADPAHDEAQAQ